MKLTNQEKTIELTNDIQIRAFIASGWQEVKGADGGEAGEKRDVLGAGDENLADVGYADVCGDGEKRSDEAKSGNCRIDENQGGEREADANGTDEKQNDISGGNNN